MFKRGTHTRLPFILVVVMVLLCFACKCSKMSAASTLDDILVGIFRKTSNYTPSAEDLACHADIFEHLHAKHNSNITTTNIKSNLAWVPLLDIVEPHQNEGEEMMLGENVHLM